MIISTDAFDHDELYDLFYDLLVESGLVDEIQSNIEECGGDLQKLAICIKDQPATYLFLPQETKLEEQLIKAFLHYQLNLVDDKPRLFPWRITLTPSQIRNDDIFCQNLGFLPFDAAKALKIIEQNPSKIPLLSPKCWSIIGIVLEAVKVDISYFDYASEEIRNSVDIQKVATQAIRNSPGIIDKFPKCFWHNKDVVLEILRSDFYYFETVPQGLQDDADVLYQVLKSAGRASSEIIHCTAPWFSNKESWLLALKYDYKLFDYAEPEIRADDSVLREFLSQKYTVEEKMSTKEMLLEVIKIENEDGLEDLLAILADHWFSNKDFMLDAIKLNGLFENYLDEDLWEDDDICAVLEDPNNLFIKLESTNNVLPYDYLLECIEADVTVFRRYLLEYCDVQEISNLPKAKDLETYREVYGIKKLSPDTIQLCEDVFQTSPGYFKELCDTSIILEEEIILSAVSHNPSFLTMAGKPLLEDAQFLLRAYEVKSN